MHELSIIKFQLFMYDFTRLADKILLSNDSNISPYEKSRLFMAVIIEQNKHL